MTRKRNDYGCLVRYIIKHTPVHNDTHDNINLILANKILLFNIILVFRIPMFVIITFNYKYILIYTM